MQKIHCNNLLWVFIFLTHITTVDKEIIFVRPFMLCENNLDHKYHINVYKFNSCSNYLLTFAITCLKFSAHLPSDFVYCTKM